MQLLSIYDILKIVKNKLNSMVIELVDKKTASKILGITREWLHYLIKNDKIKLNQYKLASKKNYIFSLKEIKEIKKQREELKKKW